MALEKRPWSLKIGKVKIVEIKYSCQEKEKGKETEECIDQNLSFTDKTRLRIKDVRIEGVKIKPIPVRYSRQKRSNRNCRRNG